MVGTLVVDLFTVGWKSFVIGKADDDEVDLFSDRKACPSEAEADGVVLIVLGSATTNCSAPIPTPDAPPPPPLAPAAAVNVAAVVVAFVIGDDDEGDEDDDNGNVGEEVEDNFEDENELNGAIAEGISILSYCREYFVSFNEVKVCLLAACGTKPV